MELETLKQCTDWFRVISFKDLADPTHQVERKELVISLDQYPYNFGLGPNPRQPVLTSRVSKKIGSTLEGASVVGQTLSHYRIVEEIQLYVRDASGNRTYVTLRELVEAVMGATVTRADLQISRSRDGEIFITSRQDGIIRMLVPDSD